MRSHDTPEELHLTVERGGSLTCTPAADARQRAQFCTVAWGLSRLFAGNPVHVQDWLPGLHLDIRAGRFMDCLPPMRQEDLDWAQVENMLCSELQRPARRETLQYAYWNLHCAMHLGGAPHHAAHAVAFTLQCQWPSVLGGWKR